MIKVMIERQLQAGLEEEYNQASRALLKACTERSGYISGESLQDLKNPGHRIILTHWKDERSWYEWEHSPERQRLLGGIAAILAADEKVILLAPL